jgi:hypothetical protein
VRLDRLESASAVGALSRTSHSARDWTAMRSVAKVKLRSLAASLTAIR